MAIKNQGFEFNRTLTNFLANADFGAFATATQSVILKGDAARKQYITGFSFCWRVGAIGEINPAHFLQVSLLEGVTPSSDSNISPFPEQLGGLRFVYADTAPLFQNQLEKTLDTPFRLSDGVQYAMVAQATLGAVITTSTSFFTVFGFQESQFEKKDSIYRLAR